MIISAHQPAFIPWPGYYHKILLADKFVHLDDVQFERNSFSNRNLVGSRNQELWAGIPVQKKGQMGISIKDVLIADPKWNIKLEKTLLQHYRRQPFFDECYPFYERAFRMTEGKKYLIDVIWEFLQTELHLLDIDTPCSVQSHEDITGQKNSLIINLTKKMEGTHFLFGSLGKQYADFTLFRENKIQVEFQKFTILPFQSLTQESGGPKATMHYVLTLGPKIVKQLLQNQT